ncbi:hypothetical protein ACFW04_004830 [Cataglyphis niger]
MFQVSWMRKRDMHILSAGILMYTSDLRFQVIHPDKSENWTLQIKSPQERDSGVYECQVSTEPKMSLNYSLNVIAGSNRLKFKRLSAPSRDYPLGITSRRVAKSSSFKYYSKLRPSTLISLTRI